MVMYEAKSKFFNADDLNGGDRELVIAAVEVEEFPDGPKFLVEFDGERKRLVLNVMNGRALVGVYGKDTNYWINKRVLLYAAETNYKGQAMPGVRLRPISPASDKPEEIPM